MAIVLRCTGRSGEQCSFFLWDEHEPTALKKLAARTASQSPILLTPTSSISTPSTAYYIPTAGTLTPTSTVPTRNRRLQLMDQESPTRRLGKDVVAPPLIADDIQYKDEHESDNDSDEEDSIPLLSEILDRFKADGIRLKLSTKEFLREILGERFAIYDAELRTKKDSITRLSRKLDRLTVK